MSPLLRSRCTSLGAIASVLVAATCTTESVPVAQDRSGRPYRWERSDWLVHIDSASASPQGTSALENAARFAFGGWSVVATFERRDFDVPVSEDGRNTITLLSDGDFAALGIGADGDAQTRLYARPSKDGQSAEVVEADIAIKASAVHLDTSKASAELHALLLHEVGHFLGLDHACSESPQGNGATPSCQSFSDAAKSAMFPNALAAGRERVQRPSSAELAAVSRLYSQ